MIPVEMHVVSAIEWTLVKFKHKLSAFKQFVSNHEKYPEYSKRRLKHA